MSTISQALLGVWMQVAPLRVRPADVADLQKLFVRGIAKSRGQGPLALTPEAVLQLESYSFPGNIKVCRFAFTCACSPFLIEALIIAGMYELVEGLSFLLPCAAQRTSFGCKQCACNLPFMFQATRRGNKTELDQYSTQMLHPHSKH